MTAEHRVLLRRLAVCVVLVPIAFGALIGGCGDADDETRSPGAVDAGAVARDASASDADLSNGPDVAVPDDAGRGSDAGPSPMPPPPPELDAGGPPVTCGNLQSDEPGGRDCEDVATCGATPICCADSEHPGCCAPPSAVLPLIDFGACLSGTGACLAELELAGSPMPAGQDVGGAQALWLGGSSDAEGVALSTVALDPSGALEVTANIAILAGCESRGVCAETVAVGLTASAFAADAVAQAVAAVISLDTAQLLLVEGGVVLARTGLPSTAGAVGLGARLSADGRLSALLDGVEQLSVELDVARPRALRAVLFGRGGNGSANHAFVRSIEAVASTCDRPRSFVVDDTPVALRQLGSGATANVVIERMVGAEHTDGTRRFVVAERRMLRPALQDADGSLSIDVTSAGAIVPPLDRDAVLAGLLPPSETTMWRLVVVLDGRDVFAYDGDGMRFEASSASHVTSAELLGVPSIDEPSVVRHDGALVLAFVTPDEAGRSTLRTASGHEGAMELDVANVVTAESPSSFDRDGVASPALVSSRGLLDLYYVGRRGVSDSVGLARRSGPDNPWVRYAPSPVLDPSAVPWSNIIAVGAPSIVLATPRDGIARIDLHFVAFDGATRVLGRARRSVPAL